MLLKILISVLALHICNSYCNANQTTDCIIVCSCPEAIRFGGNANDREKINTLSSLLFGSEVVDGKKLPKVYCSQYGTIEDRSPFSDESPPDAIESHPNVNLLPQDCGKISGDRIISGKVANLYEFPWMALISYRTRGNPGSKRDLEFECGGSIINSNYILTVAHCVVDKKLVGVRIGELDIDSKEDCQGEYPNIVCERNLQDISVEEVIPHEDYQKKPSKNDIALLRLKKSIDFSYKNAAPICLPVSQNLRNVDLDRKIATVAGWGMTENGSESHILLKVNVHIVNATTCRNRLGDDYTKNTTSGKICAGEVDKDSCYGDSGGPLMIEGEVDGVFKILQYGIVSFGFDRCGSTSSGVYTNVPDYIKWILDKLKP